jgi:hypothetical protein
MFGRALFFEAFDPASSANADEEIKARSRIEVSLPKYFMIETELKVLS